MQTSIQEIRRRLFILLARAFFIVLLLSLIFFISVTGYFLTSSSTPVPFPFVSTLEGYYLATGNWNNVEKVFDTLNGLDTLDSILLDENQRIMLDRRTDSPAEIDSIYQPTPDDLVIELRVKEKIVGYLIITSFSLTSRLGLVRAILLPIGIISFILALFLFIVAI
ncbi:MAG: hypothetical protein JNJ43_13030, partial [Anaerolineales bacterium]|nr:hypothetical protein [Anaerolineales bacterium]